MNYITRMGQNTGTLKASKKVHTMATKMPLVAACLWKERSVVSTGGGPGAEGRELNGAPTNSAVRRSLSPISNQL